MVPGYGVWDEQSVVWVGWRVDVDGVLAAVVWMELAVGVAGCYIVCHIICAYAGCKL